MQNSTSVGAGIGQKPVNEWAGMTNYSNNNKSEKNVGKIAPKIQGNNLNNSTLSQKNFKKDNSENYIEENNDFKELEYDNFGNVIYNSENVNIIIDANLPILTPSGWVQLV